MEQTNLKALEEPWQPKETDQRFEANGRVYVVSKKLSIERLALHQRFETEFGFGATFLEIQQMLAKIFNLLNDKKFAESAVMIHNTMQGIVKVDERELSALRVCTLFINREGEDLSTYSDDIASEKIEDWKRANIDPLYFFQLAAISSNGFINAYKEITQKLFNRGKEIRLAA